MAKKTFNGRIVHKHDTAENWSKATSFIPKQGELIIYDIDAEYDYERFKIGDGKTVISDLPFAVNGTNNDSSSVVDLESDQTVNGVKTFLDGIVIGNGVLISYDQAEGALRFSFLPSETEESVEAGEVVEIEEAV